VGGGQQNLQINSLLRFGRGGIQWKKSAKKKDRRWQETRTRLGLGEGRAEGHRGRDGHRAKNMGGVGKGDIGPKHGGGS